MSRLAVYRLAMAAISLSLLIVGGRALVGRSGENAGAPQRAHDETGIAEKGARSGQEATSPAQPLSGSGTGDEVPAPGRGKPDAGPDRVALSERPFPAPIGWPGIVEAELRFEIESSDPQWAKPMENRLLSMISELDDLALSRLEAECRESMCRLLLIYPPGIEPIYTIRQIYDRVDGLGLGPLLAETEVEEGELEILRLFLRRRAAISSPR